MATRDKRRRWSPRRRRVPSKAAHTAEPKSSPDKTPEAKAKAGSDETPQTEPVIKKGIYVSALIYIEGEQAAPADFAAPATDALKKRLNATFDEEGPLRMSLKKVEVQNDIEEEDEADRKGEEKFQF